MFKKLKDKIAEEVKSSPQRIQQLAQAAQAAVTSASSSISDISNNDLFTIADEDTPQNSPFHTSGAAGLSPSGFQDVSLSHSPSPLRQGAPPPDKMAAQSTTAATQGAGRLRKLSNSSNASDVSFRLPIYETPGSLYHLQSDVDASASEMEDNIPIGVQLERVSKEQLYSAYKRTNDKYNKYRGRYTDLARHYRNLERENAKARAVLVETQDKALRRISELREQCALEQSAKAHLENALRLDLDDRNNKIESLNTKIKLLQSYGGPNIPEIILNNDSIPVSSNHTDPSEPVQVNDAVQPSNGETKPVENHQPLIDFSIDQPVESAPAQDDQASHIQELESKHFMEVHSLNNKIQKLEQLLVKCKETIKTHKDKNSQITTEIQIISTQLDKKTSENEELNTKFVALQHVNNDLVQSKAVIKDLRQEIAKFEEKQVEGMAGLKKDLEIANETIAQLNETIDVLNKREEENVISLAENKLSVHKELEMKEKEIKVLKDTILAANLEIKSNEVVVSELKSNIKALEEEKGAMKGQLSDLQASKERIMSLEEKLKAAKGLNQELEAKCVSLLENVKCTELQVKQEVDEKLAMIDRNNFLEGRNKHLADENASKNKQIADLVKEILDMNKDKDESNGVTDKYSELLSEHQKLQNSCEELKRTKEDVENELNIINEKCKKMEDNVEQLLNKNSTLKSQLEESSNDLNEKTELIEREEEILERIKNENNELVERIQNLEGQVKELNRSRESCEAEAVKTLQAELKAKLEKESNSKIIFEEKLKECDELKKKYEDVCSKLDEYECKFDLLENDACQVEQLKETNKALSEEYNKVEWDNKNAHEELDIAQNEVQQLMTEKTNMEKKLIIMESENTEIKDKLADTIRNIDSLQAELLQVRNSHCLIVEEKDRIAKKIATMEEAENQKLGEMSHKLDENEELQNKMETLQREKEALVKERDSLAFEKDVLISERDSFISEKDNFNSEKNNLISEKESLIAERDNSFSEKDVLVIERDSLLNEKESLLRENSEVISEKDSLINEKESVVNERNGLLEELSKVKEELQKSEVKLKQFGEDYEVWQVKLSNILDANNVLHEKCGRLKLEKEVASEKIANLEQKQNEYDGIRKQFEEEKLEKEFLNMQVNQLEVDLKVANAEKNKLDTERDSLQKELAQTVNERKDKIQVLNEDLAKLKVELENTMEENVKLKNQCEIESKEKNALSEKLNSFEGQTKNTDSLLEEKGSLEIQLSELQEKYKNIETTKSREIDELKDESKQLKIKNEGLEIRCNDFDDLSHSNASYRAEIEQMKVKLKVLEQIEAENTSMTDELHILKSEKSKLMSDIEGLQAHLTKVSKDNSQLNDQLREMIASGEVMHTAHYTDNQSGVATEIKLNKLTETNNQLLEQIKSTDDLNARISDLERQNSILVDEKLELQDQINSSMDRHENIGLSNKNEKEFELNSLRMRTKEMAVEKSELERRLADLELMSRSGDSNIKVLEQRNEKLKLTNEKLERRLDEALVSLNHIRTLEENTELEYLRNILYEYLTGPSNNNMVLAKVLAAVVKFDQRQTQLVLEREKERQGVLGQLGLL